MEPTPTPPETRRDFSDQEQHYKSLIELFKYCVTFAGILFSVLAIAVGYVTFKDGQEMRADQRAARKDIQDNLREMRADIQKERDRLEQLAARSRTDLADQQKDINTKQAAIEGTVTGLLTRAGQEISSTRTEALRQIGGVKSEAITTARLEARNSINDVFKARNLEDFIESVAKNKLDPKIKALVDNGIKKASVDFDDQIAETQLLTELTSIYNAGSPYGILRLDSLARFGKNLSTRQRARDALQELRLVQFADGMERDKYNQKYYKLTGDSLIILFFKEYLPKYSKRPLPSEPIIMQLISKVVTTDTANVKAMLDGFSLFNRLTFGNRPGDGAPLFDYAAYEVIYADYRKRLYPLRMGKR